MAIESNWENCKSESITKDLINMHERMKHSEHAKKSVPIYPAWVRNYADKFGMVEEKDFIVSEGYTEVE